MNDTGFIFSLSSVTYAIKAQSILRKNGYRCEVIKTPKDMGKSCGYSIRAYGDRMKARVLLSKQGIDIKSAKPPFEEDRI